MNKAEAEVEFMKLKSKLKPKCPLPMNKQKADKKNYAFLTGMVNMLIEANIGDSPCNYDPRHLTTLTHDSMPLRTLARRVDGAYPSVVNPVAIWEIKEYYYTATFGSRVADGVYETAWSWRNLNWWPAEKCITYLWWMTTTPGGNADGHISAGLSTCFTWVLLTRSFLGARY